MSPGHGLRLVHEGLDGAAMHLWKRICGDPGCNLAEAQEASRLSRRRFETAMQILLDVGLVLVHVDGRSRHVFPFVPGLRNCVRQVLALRCPDLKALHAWLAEQGPCPRRTVLEWTMRELDWSASGACKRLRRLQTCDLVSLVAPPVGEDQRRTWLKAQAVEGTAKRMLEALHGEGSL